MYLSIILSGKPLLSHLVEDLFQFIRKLSKSEIKVWKKNQYKTVVLNSPSKIQDIKISIEQNKNNNSYKLAKMNDIFLDKLPQGYNPMDKLPQGYNPMDKLQLNNQSDFRLYIRNKKSGDIRGLCGILCDYALKNIKPNFTDIVITKKIYLSGKSDIGISEVDEYNDKFHHYFKKIKSKNIIIDGEIHILAHRII